MVITFFSDDDQIRTTDEEQDYNKRTVYQRHVDINFIFTCIDFLLESLFFPDDTQIRTTEDLAYKRTVVIRLGLDKLLVNQLQVVKRTNTPLIP